MLQIFEQTYNKLKTFGLLTDQEQKQAADFFLWAEQNLKQPSDYMLFLQSFNKITGKKYTGDHKSRELFYEKAAVYSVEERIQAVKNAITDPWLIENSTALTPEYILRPTMTAKYISYNSPKTTIKLKKNDTERNYSELQAI